MKNEIKFNWCAVQDQMTFFISAKNDLPAFNQERADIRFKPSKFHYLNCPQLNDSLVDKYISYLIIMSSLPVSV